MLEKFLKTTLAFVAITALALPATAQVSQIPNSGCPGAPYIGHGGTPGIGQGFGVFGAPCRTRGGQPFLVAGTTGAGQTFPVPPACTRGCVLACTPLVILFQPGIKAQIPNNRALIGVTICFQSGCIEQANPACIYLHGAISVTITP